MPLTLLFVNVLWINVYCLCSVGEIAGIYLQFYIPELATNFE